MIGVIAKFPLSVLSALGGFFEGAKAPKVHRLVVMADFCYPLTANFVPIYADHTRSVVYGLCHIARIFKPRDVSQVANAVIGSVAVNVIKFVLRPFAVVHKPANPVHFINFVTDSGKKVSGAMQGSGWLQNSMFQTAVQNPAVRVVDVGLVE